MKTEIFIEGQPLDLMDDLPTEFTYAIDDIQDFGSKNTSFSKTLNIAGSANNNKIFGFVFDLGNANNTNSVQSNIGYNFNATKASQCRIFVDGIQVFKGILRLLEIVRTGEVIEYQCSVFGELGGFITALGNSKLEDLNFSAYDRTWSYANITNSWNTIAGSGIYFPLIDIGGVSTAKVNFEYNAFRPSLYVKEYLEKILASSGYTWNFPLLSTALINRLVVPNNQKQITRLSNIAFYATAQIRNYTSADNVRFTVTTAGSFTANANSDVFTYGSATSFTGAVYLTVAGRINLISPLSDFTIHLKLNGTPIKSVTYTTPGSGFSFNANLNVANVTINNTNTLEVDMVGNVADVDIQSGIFNLTSSNPIEVKVNYNESIAVNNTIPKGIFQRDFFLSICKMFNLYVYEDQWDSKKIIIKPYIDFYDGSFIDWSNKIDRSKPLSIKPMSEINARYFQFKYKSDNDFYNDNYRKKFNENYADRLYDTEFDFVKETDTTEVIFASSPLYQATGTDKIYPAIYKKSNANAVEDSMDFVVRIMQAKKITGRTSWTITNGGTSVGSNTVYGYAGHLDDPFTPTNDINFGAPKEIYFTATTYPTTNLFNAYYSDYMAEITDKDSKLLKCEALLNIADIQNLDFSKLIMIDNQLFRLNKIDGYSIIDYKTSKVELLKVITKVF